MVESRPTAVFECPDCSDRVTVSHPDSLSDVVILCECNRNFPRMEHQRGHLNLPQDTESGGGETDG